jgi:hypothetical protein
MLPVDLLCGLIRELLVDDLVEENMLVVLSVVLLVEEDLMVPGYMVLLLRCRRLIRSLNLNLSLLPDIQVVLHPTIMRILSLSLSRNRNRNRSSSSLDIQMLHTRLREDRRLILLLLVVNHHKRRRALSNCISKQLRNNLNLSNSSRMVRVHTVNPDTNNSSNLNQRFKLRCSLSLRSFNRNNRFSLYRSNNNLIRPKLQRKCSLGTNKLSRSRSRKGKGPSNRHKHNLLSNNSPLSLNKLPKPLNNSNNYSRLHKPLNLNNINRNRRHNRVHRISSTRRPITPIRMYKLGRNTMPKGAKT